MNFLKRLYIRYRAKKMRSEYLKNPELYIFSSIEGDDFLL